MQEKKRATDGTRTHDPSLTKRLLCQLSYGGVRKLRLRGRTYGSPLFCLPKLDGVRKLRLRLALPQSGNATRGCKSPCLA